MCSENQPVQTHTHDRQPNKLVASCWYRYNRPMPPYCHMSTPQKKTLKALLTPGGSATAPLLAPSHLSPTVPVSYCPQRRLTVPRGEASASHGTRWRCRTSPHTEKLSELVTTSPETRITKIATAMRYSRGLTHVLCPGYCHTRNTRTEGTRRHAYLPTYTDS